MTTGRPQALLTLKRVRGEVKKGRELELGQAAESLRQAESALAQADERCQARRQRLEQAREAAAPQLARDLQRAQSWQARLESELAELEATRVAALEVLQQRRGLLGAAQQALARASAELEVVEQAWEAWDQARRAVEQRRAEEELADLVAARRYG